MCVSDLCIFVVGVWDVCVSALWLFVLCVFVCLSVFNVCVDILPCVY